MTGTPWWRDAVVYQVYVRSFADSDGDGVGDLDGITSKLGYLASLGVDAVWLTPFFRSPMADHGYDVADYRDVDPMFGDLPAFDRLLGSAHQLGLRVIVDVVPNHTSSAHPWFEEALASPPGSAARQRYLFTGVTPDKDKFAALHAALFSGGTFLYVPEGVTIDAPLVSQFWSAGSGSAVLPHSLVIGGKGSRFQYVDEFLSGDRQETALASGSAEVFLEESANVGYVALQHWSIKTWQFANQRFQLGRDSHLNAVAIALGGQMARLRVEAILEGPGSSADLKGLFFGTGDQAFDFRTLQDHVGPHTTSDLLFKGALRDRAKSVYVGVVRVEPEARGSSSNQANRNLLLSDKAKATSEPILEILNNDILRCSHGATVGPVDPEHLFYLESRGIPHPVAERMLVQGFLGEVLDRIPVRQVRDAVEQELAARIE